MLDIIGNFVTIELAAFKKNQHRLTCLLRKKTQCLIKNWLLSKNFKKYWLILLKTIF